MVTDLKQHARMHLLTSEAPGDEPDWGEPLMVGSLDNLLAMALDYMSKGRTVRILTSKETLDHEQIKEVAPLKESR